MMEMRQAKGGGSNLDGTVNKSFKSRITKKDKDAGSAFDSNEQSSDYEDDSEMQSDVSGETHSYKQSSDSSDTVYSSDDGESGLDINQTIRVYDARFKIPAQTSVGQLMTDKKD